MKFTIENLYHETQNGQVLHNPNLFFTKKTTFNKHGDEVEISIHHVSLQKTQITKIENTYDKNKKITLSISNKNTENEILRKFIYFERLLKEIEVTSHLFSASYIHDYNGYLYQIKTISIPPEAKKMVPILNIEYFFYNEKGNVSKKEYENKICLNEPCRDFHIDCNFRKIETFKYDENDNIIEKYYSVIDKEIIDKVTYKNEPAITFKYIYDIQNNWISKKEYQDNKPINPNYALEKIV